MFLVLHRVEFVFYLSTHVSSFTSCRVCTLSTHAFSFICFFIDVISRFVSKISKKCFSLQIITFCGVILFTNMVAFVLMLGLESPMIGLEKALLPKRKD